MANASNSLLSKSSGHVQTLQHQEWCMLIHAQHKHISSLVGVNSKCLGRANKKREKKKREGISPGGLTQGLVICGLVVEGTRWMMYLLHVYES